MKKILIFILLLLVFGCEKKDSNEYSIIATNFPSYDFARAITVNSPLKVSMLLKPGNDIHDFELTPKDMIDIKTSKLFIYTGGDSDDWVKNVLKNIDDNTRVIKLMDLVNLKKEVINIDENDHSDEDDEHVWTSLLNAISIINQLKEEIIKIDYQNKSIYENNANNYIEKIKTIHEEIKSVVDNRKRNIVVFGDRFPLRYFMDDYHINYYAAFPGCSEENEASAKTISFLINKIKENNIPVVFKIELSNGQIAETISHETGAKVLEFHSCHNISKEDYEKGKTYVDLMKRNILVLKEALN